MAEKKIKQFYLEIVWSNGMWRTKNLNKKRIEMERRKNMLNKS